MEINRAMSTDERESILKEMVTHGFPLEIEVTSLMSKRGWNVINQAYYKDEDTGKMRTVDLWAILSCHPKTGRHDLVHISLIIECKKSVKPWVFYTRKKEMYDRLSVNHWSESQKLEWLTHTHHNTEDHNEIAIIPFEPFQGKNKSDILEASMQVLKALTFKKKELVELHQKLKVKKNPLCLLYPVIVFDGNLWKCELQKGNPEISIIQYMEYKIDYNGPIVVDIVQKAYLPNFLETLEKEFKLISDTVEKLA